MAEFKLGRLRFVWQGEWTTGTNYVKDDIVRYGGSSYVCVGAHTAAADFYTNFDAGKWELMTSGLQWQTEPWSSATYYPEGSVVRYGGKIYVAVDGHNSSADFNTDFDAGDWQLFVDGIQWKTSPWSSATLYKEGDLVRHGGRVYICIDGHTSSADFEADIVANDWQLFADGFQWKTSPWTAGAHYKVNDVVRYGGKTYICINEHDANSTQDGGFYVDLVTSQWQLFTDGVQWLGEWTDGTYYKLNDFVRHGGKSYVCVEGHTSDADFYTDFDANRWDLLNDGQQWITAVWSSGQLYKEGDLVRNGGKVYICIDGHTSSIGALGFNTDLAANKWQLFSDGIQWTGDWITGTTYKLGDVVSYGGRSYTAIVAHTAAEDFYTDLDAARWDLVADGVSWKDQPWGTSQLYKEGDIVRYGGKTYVCINGHTSSVDVNGGFYTDIANWQLFSDGTAWLGDWTTGIYYKIGDIVRYGGYVYVCNEGHLSSATVGAGLEADQSKWDLYSETFKFRQDWNTGTRYVVNDVVKFGGSLYICTAFHVSGSNFDETKWNVFIGGLEFEDTWSAVVEYQLGDIVTYGGYSYVAVDRNTGNIPPNEPAHWELLTVGFKIQGEWSASTSYKVGDFVRYGGNSYVAIVNTTPGQVPTNEDGSTAVQWQLVTESFKWRNEWAAGTDYRIGDTVRFVASTYRCVLDHNSDTINSQPDLDTLGIYWQTIAEGAEGNVLYRRGDLVTRNATTTTRIPRGLPGQVLQVKNLDATWDYFNKVEKVYYVKPDGIDSDDRGTTLETAFKTVKYATEYILADEARRAPATIFVKTGYFYEELPIRIPKNVAIVGDELRSTRIIAAPGKGIASIAVSNGGSGYSLRPYAEVLLTANRTFLQEEIIAWIAANVVAGTTYWQNFTYDEATCYRDVGYIVDALIYDLQFGGNERTIKAARRYWDGMTSNIAGQERQTVDAINKLRDIINTNILTNTTYSAYQGTVTQTTNANNAEAGTSTRVTALIGVITTVIQSGLNQIPATAYATDAVEVQFSAPTSTTGHLPEGYAVVNNGVVTSIVLTKAGSGYTTAPEITVVGRGAGALATATLQEKVYSLGDMFYMRDGSGLRNCTLAGLSGILTAPNQYLTRRPTAGAYVSLDPGYGPGDESVWVFERSPYVQNVTNFGDGCTGLKIDGAIHNGGNKTIVCNDFTQVLNDGIGIWCTNQGRVENVSVFCYYTHIGYLAENGGVIRSTNGNSSYGTYGVAAEGVDPTEVSRIAKVDNRRLDAQIVNVITDGNGIISLEYSNAGENYVAGTTTYNFSGTGIISSITGVTPVIQNGGVKEVRILDGGLDWLSVINNAQNGDTKFIRISASDIQETDAYVGMRIVIVDGVGVGQYAYVTSFNGGTKELLPAKESFTPLTITASSNVTNRFTTNNTSSLTLNMPIQFNGTTFGGIDRFTVYYVKSIISSTEFTISTVSGGTTLALDSGTGSMQLHANGWETFDGRAVEVTLDTTTRYTIEPRITFSTGSGATANATISKGLDAFSGTTNGAGFQAAPTVLITGTETNATGATATASIAGGVESVVIKEQGSGFTGTPNVQFVGGGGSNAAGVANVIDTIGTVTVTAGGSGYTVPPLVEISGAGYNNDAYVSANITNIVGEIEVTSNGAGFTAVPTVTISGGGGVGATAVANLNAVVTGFTLIEGGQDYVDGTTTVTISRAAGDTTGAGAQATAIISNGVITGFTLVDPGTGYSKPPIVTITSSGVGSGASAIANILGTVDSVTILNGGRGYITAPDVVISGGGGYGAEANATITGSVDSLDIISGGTGFTGSVSLNIVSKNGVGGGATATASVIKAIGSVTITDPGSGYTSPPTVAITGGNGVGCLATTTINGVLTGLSKTAPGRGYTTTPTVAFVGGHNFKSVVAGQAYYRNASSLRAISPLQITQTLAAIERIKPLVRSLGQDTDPAQIYQNIIDRTVYGSAVSDAGIKQAEFWVDVMKAIIQNGESNTNAADILEDNRTFMVAETVAYVVANSSGFVHDDADVRKRAGLVVDALVNDLRNGSVSYTVSIGQKYAMFIANEMSVSADILNFIETLAQDIILNTEITPINTESAAQVFSPLLVAEITAPQAITNNINLMQSIVYLNGTLGDAANSTFADRIVDNSVWIKAEITEFIKTTYPTFEYDQELCARDVGYILKAIAHDIENSQASIPTTTASTTNVLSQINVVTGGEGYGQGTTVSFSGDLGTGVTPTATPIITDGVITGFTITNPGSGYTAAPNVAINVGAGSGALARAYALGGLLEEIRIIHPGSGYTAAPYIKITDPNNTLDPVFEVRIGDGVLDQPTFGNRGTGFVAATATVTGEGYADIYQVGEYLYVKNLTNIPTPGANVTFENNNEFYKLVSVREVVGPTGIIGGKNLLVANKQFVQAQIIAYINSTYPFLEYDETLCARDVGYIIDAIASDIFGDTEKGIEAGKAYYRNVSAIKAITDGGTDSTAQRTATIAAIDKLIDYAEDIIQNITVPRNQLTELQVKEPTITTGIQALPAMTTTVNIIKNIINNGPRLYGVADNLLDNKAYIEAEIIAYINTTYPDFEYNEELCSRDVGLIVDALAYDLFGGLTRSREAGLRYYSNASALVAIGPQKTETVAAITQIATVVNAVIQNQTPTITYQNAVSRVTGLTSAIYDDTAKVSTCINEIVNIINNGVGVLPSGQYTARLQLSPALNVNTVPSDSVQLTIRSKYSQVRLTGHDFLNVGTGNKSESNYPGIPVNPVTQENEVLESGGGRCFYTSTDQDGNFRVGELFKVEQATGVATLNAQAFNLSGLNELSLGGVTLGGTGAVIREFSTDGTFLANSDNIVPTQKAIKTFISSQLGSGGGNLAVNAITAGDIQITATEISTNKDVLSLTVPDGIEVTQFLSSTSPTTGSLVVNGGVGIQENLNVADDVNVGGDLVVTGNLTVEGDTTTLNIGTLSVEDVNITVAKAATNATQADGAGITVVGPTTPATMTYASADDTWNFNKVVKAPSIQSTVIGTNGAAAGAFTTLSASGLTTVTNTTNATSTASAALVVTGGIAAGADMIVGGSGTFTSGLTSTGSTTLSPANSNVVISPTGAGSVTVNPGTTGTVDNMNIGVTTRGSGAFNTLTSNGATTFTAGTSSTTSGTGTVVVTGGVGISENLNVGGNAIITGNLTVNGTTTTVNSTTVTVDDITLELGSVASPTDATANGGGIILKGTSDKTILWDSGNANWTSSEHVNIASGKVYKINNTTVLSSTQVFGKSLGGTSTGDIVTIDATQTLTNKTFTDNVTYFQDQTDTSKKMQFDISSVAASTTRTLTVPNQNGTIAVTSDIGNGTLTLNVSGNGLSGSQTFTANQGTAATFTVTSNATNANTANTIVYRDASGNFSAGTITATLSGNASTATNVAWSGVTGKPTRSDWSTVGSLTNVVGQLAWRNYGNGHTIFDASNSVSPDGGAVNNTNPANNWSATYPTLMGWNGSSTYGVRVDVSRLSESCSGNAATATNASNTNSISNAVGSSYTWTGNQNFQSGNSVGTNGQAGTLATYGNSSGTNAATMSFHRPGAYAINMGLDTDNVFRIGGWSDGSNVYRSQLDASGNLTIRGTLTEQSSITLKENVTQITNPLEAIMGLVGVTYDRKDGSRKNEAGLIAEQVAEVLPNLATYDKEGKAEGVQYTKLTAYLLEAIKALKAEIDELKGNK